MNINPVSFGKTVKVVGNNSVDSAYRMANLINGMSPFSKKEQGVRQQLWRIFDDVTLANPAQVLKLNNDKDVYILTGDESKKLRELESDRTAYINAAYKTYGNNVQITSVVEDSENDRYEALAGDLVEFTKSGAINAKYSTRNGQVKSINFKA